MKYSLKYDKQLLLNFSLFRNAAFGVPWNGYIISLYTEFWQGFLTIYSSLTRFTDIVYNFGHEKWYSFHFLQILSIFKIILIENNINILAARIYSFTSNIYNALISKCHFFLVCEILTRFKVHPIVYLETKFYFLEKSVYLQN